MIDIIIKLVLFVFVFFICLIMVKRFNKPVYDGRLVLSKNEEGIKVFNLLLDEDLEMLEHKTSINFKVINNMASSE
jgi:hypothetical protein